MRTVELVGLPGSGKSTIVAEAGRRVADAECLGYAEVMPLERGRPFARTAHVLGLGRVICARPSVWPALASAMLAGDRRQRARVVKYVDLCVRLRRHAHRGSLAILDQGPMQALVSILVEGARPSARRAPALVRAATRLWLPDTVCFVEVEAETAAARLGARDAGGSFFDGLDPDAVLARYRPAQTVLSEVVDLIESSGRVTVVRLKGEDSAELNGSIVARVAIGRTEAPPCASA